MNPPVFVPPAAPSPLRLDPGPRGHRYGLDAFLLADFAEVSGESLVADLGTGTGVVALLMAYRRPGLRVVGVELQGEFLRVAAANARRSRLVGSIAFVQADLRRTAAWAKGGRFDAVVVNPPYHKLGTGRLSPDPGRAMARCEVALDVPTWLGAARHLLSAGGRLFVVFLAERESELVSRMKEKGLPARRLRRVHPAAGRPATTVLVEGAAEESATPGRAVCCPRVLSPLVVYQETGLYTEEVRRMYGSFGIDACGRRARG